MVEGQFNRTSWGTRRDESSLPQQRLVMNPAPRSARKRHLALTIAAVFAVWIYARFYGLASFSAHSLTCSFTEPCEFIAVPGGDAAHVNVRAGPGTEFPIRKEIDRGSPVTGISRQHNASGEPWIELPENQGFAKEALLVPLPTTGNTTP